MLFRDPGFEAGLRLSATSITSRPLHLGTVLSARPEAEPSWRLAQWGSRFPLVPTQQPEQSGPTTILANAGKAVAIERGAQPLVSLTVRGSEEFGTRARQWGENWPHLLIEQTFADPVRPSTLEALRFHLRFRVTRCSPLEGAPQDRGLHTAQVSAYWILQNTNVESPDYRDMLWFGLPVCDARYAIPRGHRELDRGHTDASGKFIYLVAGREFWNADVKDGRWHTLDVELLPYLDEALRTAQGRGLLGDSTLGDMALTSFNLGWEVTGAWDATIELTELRLAGR